MAAAIVAAMVLTVLLPKEVRAGRRGATCWAPERPAPALLLYRGLAPAM
jgi:hypothetical protein